MFQFCFDVSFYFRSSFRTINIYTFLSKVKSLSMYNFNNLKLYFLPLGRCRSQITNQFYQWICHEYYQRFGAVVVFCTKKVFIEIRKYCDFRLHVLWSAHHSSLLKKNVSLVFVSSSPRLFWYLAEVLLLIAKYMWNRSAVNIEYFKNRLRSLFFVQEFDRPDFIVGLYLYINLT